MMISEIRRLKNGRYGLFCGENFILSLDEETLVRYGPKAGEDLDERALECLKSRAQAQKAKEKAFVLLSYRDHSKEELRRKLVRGSSEEAAEKAANKMEELGLVNDGEYAVKLAKELLFRRYYGKNRVIYEMVRRGLPRDMAEDTVEQLDDDPQARALCFIQKKYPGGLTDKKQLDRAAGALARNGFGWEDIRQTLKNYRMDEEDAD